MDRAVECPFEATMSLALEIAPVRAGERLDWPSLTHDWRTSCRVLARPARGAAVPERAPAVRVKPYQAPSYGLRMQIEMLLEHLRSEEWRQRFKALREALSEDLDLALDAKGRERLAAGVFFEGTKPSTRSG